MKLLAFLSLLLFTITPEYSGSSSIELNKEVTENGRTFLYGPINREGLNSGQYQRWFSVMYNNYSPNVDKLKACKEEMLAGVTVKLLMATWCGDSKRNVPAFFKVMDQLNFSEDRIEAWALNLRKQGPNNEQQRFGVTRVPTIIFYRDDVEIGRFVERPKPGETLEDKILDILMRP